jgi:hypothetical protein
MALPISKDFCRIRVLGVWPQLRTLLRLIKRDRSGANMPNFQLTIGQSLHWYSPKVSTMSWYYNVGGFLTCDIEMIDLRP